MSPSRSRRPDLAYRFNVYHIIEVDALAPLFPVEIEDL
jgi:hypothetical protein